MGLPLRILFFVFICFLSLRTEARIYIQIDQPSEKKFPIAVDNLVPVQRGESRDWSRKTAEILRKDLALTGLFDLLSPEEFPKESGAHSPNPATILFGPWALVGAQALVNGSYSNAGGGAVRVDMHLYDPLLGQHLLGRTYTAKGKKEMSVVAHHFVDEVLKELTGEEWVFRTKIAYTQAVKKGRKEIGVMDMDGENAGTVTKDGTINLSPAWSPGGQIAYSTLIKGGSWQIALVGGKKVTPANGIFISPAWSPGGALTIASAASGDTDLYIIGLDGGTREQLTSSFGIDVNAAYCPDGSFVFASERAGRLHIFRSGGGGGAQRLTFVGSQNDNPSCSPKGDKIAFQSLAGGWGIFVMNIDGSMIQRLTSGTSCESPTWAPNARFIAASCGGRVSLMREDGTNLTAVGPGGSHQPAWGPPVK